MSSFVVALERLSQTKVVAQRMSARVVVEEDKCIAADFPIACQVSGPGPQLFLRYANTLRATMKANVTEVADEESLVRRRMATTVPVRKGALGMIEDFENFRREPR